MLELSNSNGVLNILSLDVYSRIFANTISNFGRKVANTRQYTPNFNSDYDGIYYYIELVSQLTGEKFLTRMSEISNYNYPRATQLGVYIDDYVGDYHINNIELGLYDYNVYYTSGTIVDLKSNRVIGIVTKGIALVHNKNWTNESFANSQSGVKPTIIPSSISYNG
tara:strand:+ start:604 stop:1101 length:498 start_codon:yes stop_codon:yes gene_type:complete